MRLVTWNLRKNIAALNYAFDELDADVALLQEVVASNLANLSNEQYLWDPVSGPFGVRKKFGSAIVSKEAPLVPVSFDTLYPGVLTTAETTMADGTVLTLISLYGVIVKTYSITTLHRMFSDLTHLFDQRKKKSEFIVAGDFNASIQWDERLRSNPHQLLFERVLGFGLVDCLAKFNHTPIRTFRKKGAKIPWQLDYVFCSKKLADRVVRCEVVENEEVTKLSDHNPIITEFDLGEPNFQEDGTILKNPPHGTTAALSKALRRMRMEFVRSEAVPAYLIFDDKTLAKIVRDLPESRAELLRIKGIGRVVLEKYGDAILQVLAEHRNPSPPSSKKQLLRSPVLAE